MQSFLVNLYYFRLSSNFIVVKIKRKMVFKIIILNVIYIVSATCSDFYSGYRDEEAKKIYSKHFEQSPADWMKTDIVNVNYSRKGVINEIQIADLRVDKLGEIDIKDGGIGAQFVIIELLSPGTYVGLTFWVEVFALPADHYLYQNGI